MTEQPGRVVGRAGVLICWLLALAGAGFAVSVFWPGMVSFDAAVMWNQARGYPLDTIHSPLLLYVWRLLQHLHDSPTPIWLLHLGLFWSALALLGTCLSHGARFRAAWIVLLGLVPPVWVLMAQVGTDAALIAALVMATACIMRSDGGRKRGWTAAALIMLLYAAAMRHNAAPALLPLLWVCWPSRWRPRVAATAGAFVVIVAAVLVIGTGATYQRAVWPATAMWDLAAISIAENEVLLPPGTVGPGMSVEDLEQAFEPWTNTTLFARTRAGVRQPFFEPEDGALKKTLALAWWRAVVHHPMAWLSHRWRLTRALVGTHPTSWPVELIYFPHLAQVGDNPPLTQRTDGWHRMWFGWLDRWRGTALLAAWPWLLLGIPAVGLGWRRRGDSNARLGLAVLASGWLLALPLVLVAPAAELRYLGWPIMASALALGLALAARSGVAVPPARDTEVANRHG